MIDGRRLSVTTGCLNRADFLRQALATWLRATEPDEIIVVDWSNKIPLEETLASFKDSRLVFARVSDQPTWKNAKCHNLELELSSGNLVLRLDSDYLLKEGFFAKHPITNGLFYAGNWKPWVTNVEKCSLAGTLYAHRSDVLLVNGYNERLMFYGCEDDDLFERMARSGLIRVDVDLSTIEHIPHSDRMRYENLEVADDLPCLEPNDELYNEAKRKLHLVEKSRDIADKKPWGAGDRRTPWDIQWSTSGSMARRRVDCVETVRSVERSSGSGDVSFTDSVGDLAATVRSITGTPSRHGPESDPVVYVSGDDRIFSTAPPLDKEVIARFFEAAKALTRG